MQNSKVKRFSILGLTLLATSAVVAGFNSKSTDDKQTHNGRLQAGGAGLATQDTNTCVTASANLNCVNTVTVKNGISSSGGIGSTTGAIPDGNTTENE